MANNVAKAACTTKITPKKAKNRRLPVRLPSSTLILSGSSRFIHVHHFG
jgi:hypothetical protein